MTAPRCATCNHTTAIHDRDGRCPRWAGRLDAQGLRIVVRVGNKWPECAGHTLAFLADSVTLHAQGENHAGKHQTESVGMVVVWDVTEGTQTETPLFTAREPWSSKPSHDQRADAVEQLRMETGEVVRVVGQLG